MFVDAQTLFSDAQALTVTAASTNLIDFGSDRDMSKGEPLDVVIVVDVAADGTTTDETYSFAIQTDSDVAFGSATTLASRAITYGELTLGSIHTIPVPNTNERYMRLYYTLGGTTPTVTVTAFLQPHALVEESRVTYPDGFTIS
jgi:hypothetical protein